MHSTHTDKNTVDVCSHVQKSKVAKCMVSEAEQHTPELFSMHVPL